MSEFASDCDIRDIIEKVERGVRLELEDGVRLFKTNDLLALGSVADIVRRKLNGNRTYYIVNRHINYTNICKNRCRFCAFSRSEGDAGGYALSIDEIVRKAEDARSEIDFTELHIVGGLHPELPFSYYIEMMESLKQRMPDVHIQAFTAVEIFHLAEMAGLGVSETLAQLRDAGLGSLPGGGAEIFSARVRDALCPEKISAEKWLDIMRTAHGLGIRSNTTMLYGHMETTEEKVDHLLRLRDLQDETSGFLAFIPLAYHSDDTDLGAFNGRRSPSGIEDLKTIAVSRLMLDNIPHVKVFWIMVGVKLAQIALSFGADDFDGTVVEEKITHSAGAQTPEALCVDDITRLIRETGTTPIERDTLYNEVHR